MIRLAIVFCLCTLTLSAQKKVPGNGRIQRFPHFPSNQVEPRNIDVWVPEDYPQKGPYSVIYMHDGQNLFDSTTAYGNIPWKAGEAASALLRDKKIAQCIIVGIHSNDKRFLEYNPQSIFKTLPATLQQKLVAEYQGEPISDAYLLFIVKELKPFIDNTFYTSRVRENTCIAGSSMGGLISLYAMCEYPKVFGSAACISTHWPVSLKMNDARIPKAIKAYLNKKLPLSTEHRVYFDHGTETLDKQYAPYQKEIDALMKEKGYSKKNWVTKVYSGAAHSELYWQKRFPAVLKFLLPR